MESHMKSTIAYPAFAAVILLALTPLALAQPAGAEGGVATIPSSVYRAREEGRPVTQPGILSIIASPPPASPDVDSKQATKRRDPSPTPPK
jgi:hypothetical protein